MGCNRAKDAHDEGVAESRDDAHDNALLRGSEALLKIPITALAYEFGPVRLPSAVTARRRRSLGSDTRKFLKNVLIQNSDGPGPSDVVEKIVVHAGHDLYSAMIR